MDKSFVATVLLLFKMLVNHMQSHTNLFYMKIADTCMYKLSALADKTTFCLKKSQSYGHPERFICNGLLRFIPNFCWTNSHQIKKSNSKWTKFNSHIFIHNNF